MTAVRFVSTSQLLTSADVARLFKISGRCVWRWVATGRLPAPLRFSRICLRWHWEDIEKHIAEVERRTKEDAQAAGGAVPLRVVG